MRRKRPSFVSLKPIYIPPSHYFRTSSTNKSRLGGFGRGKSHAHLQAACDAYSAQKGW